MKLIIFMLVVSSVYGASMLTLTLNCESLLKRCGFNDFLLLLPLDLKEIVETAAFEQDYSNQ
jgi:hypothetical protein